MGRQIGGQVGQPRREVETRDRDLERGLARAVNALVQRIPGAKRVLLEGTAHLPGLEAAQRGREPATGRGGPNRLVRRVAVAE